MGQREVFDYLQTTPEALTAKEIAERNKWNVGTTRANLQKLAKSKFIESDLEKVHSVLENGFPHRYVQTRYWRKE